MKMVWEPDEVADGWPVEVPLITKDENGKIQSVVYVAWFGADNNTANAMNMSLIDGVQAVATQWSEAKLGPMTPPGTAPRDSKKG